MHIHVHTGGKSSQGESSLFGGGGGLFGGLGGQPSNTTANPFGPTPSVPSSSSAGLFAGSGAGAGGGGFLKASSFGMLCIIFL